MLVYWKMEIYKYIVSYIISLFTQRNLSNTNYKLYLIINNIVSIQNGMDFLCTSETVIFKQDLVFIHIYVPPSVLNYKSY